MHVRKIAYDIGQDVARGIAHFIDDLLRDRCQVDEATRAARLGNLEGAVGTTFHYRETHGVPSIGDASPVGENPAGRLCPAFNDMAGKAAG